jgi:hypothetical protein
MAVRDEIVDLVNQRESKAVSGPDIGEAAPLPIPGTKDVYQMISSQDTGEEIQDPPRTGVEIVSVTKRGGEKYYTVRDLRNNSVVKNVTLKSSRRLWHYAISQYSKLPKSPESVDITWQGDLGMLSRKKRGNSYSFDLIQRVPDGYRYYYGVTEDGIHGTWEGLV